MTASIIRKKFLTLRKYIKNIMEAASKEIAVAHSKNLSSSPSE
jgi:hypothetical protein